MLFHTLRSLHQGFLSFVIFYRLWTSGTGPSSVSEGYHQNPPESQTGKLRGLFTSHCVSSPLNNYVCLCIEDYLAETERIMVQDR